ncbi:MAG: stage sporulation protein [Phycisphaerales bacterium]|jgi:stage II sporulation protein D|nr:stage sporulation protein [Phycisphaerales bacterium]
MGIRRLGRWATLAAVAIFLIAFVPLSCIRRHQSAEPPPNTPIVRVRLHAAQEKAILRVAAIPIVKAESEMTALRLNMAFDTDAQVVLKPSGWEISGVAVPGKGVLTIWPSEDASVSVNGRRYRGKFRFVPAGGASATTFDIVNDVDIDSYLKGVLARELLRGWDEETYSAQAIVARTYALYESRMRGRDRHWDLFPDERSQVYGGYADETSRSRAAAEETSGIVLAYGQPGRERIFKTYFGACCGGVTQSAADAFGESYIVPLSDQNLQGLCSQAPRYNWGPVELSKAELTRRLRAYSSKREGREANIGLVAKLDIQSLNRFNRPIRFLATDVNDVRYSFSGEEIRNAINGYATKESPQRLHSSFFKIINEPGSDVIKFVEGHGNGHGVGMCQYCSEARAYAGMRHEDIILSAFPRAKLVRAY